MILCCVLYSYTVIWHYTLRNCRRELAQLWGAVTLAVGTETRSLAAVREQLKRAAHDGECHRTCSGSLSRLFGVITHAHQQDNDRGSVYITWNRKTKDIRHRYYDNRVRCVLCAESESGAFRLGVPLYRITYHPLWMILNNPGTYPPQFALKYRLWRIYTPALKTKLLFNKNFKKKY